MFPGDIQESIVTENGKKGAKQVVGRKRKYNNVNAVPEGEEVGSASTITIRKWYSSKFCFLLVDYFFKQYPKCI